MSAYRPYLKYKLSGVEWVGDIPSHWAIGPTFAKVAESKSKNSLGLEENVLSLSYGNIIRRNVEDNFGLMPESFNTYQIVQSGDVILRLTDLQNDKRSLRVGLAKERGIITSAYLNLRGKSDINPSYLYQLLHSYDTTKVFYGMGGGLRQSMKFEDFRRLPLLLPSLPEQQQIASFLDRECGKLDALQAKQERLIELLKEKRQALISHAVTRGLDPTAKLKPSGIEWLGDVPEHWRMTTIKRFSTLQRGHDLTDSERTEGQYPVITSGGISGTHGSYVARGPGVVTGRYGSTGRLFYIDENFWPHNTSLYVKDFHRNLPRFVWYSLQTVDFAAHSAKAAVPGIDRNDIHALPVTVPPEDEQRAIVAHLDEKCGKIDQLKAKAERGIELLKERRSALISAAVTGKIDVRDVAAVSNRKAR